MYCLKIGEIKLDKILPYKVGDKAYTLSLLSQRGFYVPQGFVLTADAWLEYISYNKILGKLGTLLHKEENIFLQSAILTREILHGALPPQIKRELQENLTYLKEDFLAVRSSAVGEDAVDSSFAGIYASFLGVRNELSKISQAIKKCYASLYNPSALFYKKEKGMELEGVMCVLVQEMVKSRVSGVAFSSYPSPGKCRIEASFGLGNLVVSGKVQPDVFVVDGRGYKIEEKVLGSKQFAAFLREGKGVIVNEVENPGVFSLGEEEVMAIAKMVFSLEILFGVPQDVEWALDEKGNIVILQSRPWRERVNTLEADPFYSFSSTPVIRGKAFYPGEMPKEKGILILTYPEPQHIPYLKNAVAVISEVGGVLNHFAITCRELGIPFLLIRGATSKIKQGDFVEIKLGQKREGTPFSKLEGKWLKVISFIPAGPPPIVKERSKAMCSSLPKIINRDYNLTILVRDDGIYVSKSSLSKFVRDILKNLPLLCERLKNPQLLPADIRSALPILASLVIESLFQRLSELVGNESVAFHLIRLEGSLYMELEREELEIYLTRFGGIKVEVPMELREKKELARGEIEEIAGRALENLPQDKRKEAEVLSHTLRLLIKLYEDKDYPKI